MDLHKHTTNELLNIKDSIVQNRSKTTYKRSMPPPQNLEMITDDLDRDTFSSHNWTSYGGATVSVFRGDLKFVTNGDGGNEGVELAVSELKGPDGTLSIGSGTTYHLEVNLDNTAGKTTPRVNASLGGTHVKMYALDGDPNDGTINTTAQIYYAEITTTNDTGSLQVYQPSADNDASTTIVLTDFTLTQVGGTVDTLHVDVSGHKNVCVFANRTDLFYSFSTTPKDISGIRGGNASGYGHELLDNTDFEGDTTDWVGPYYEGGSGSGATLTRDNTSSPLSGSNDMKLVNGSDEVAGCRHDALTAADKEFYGNTRYRLSFNYKTNFDGENQPDAMMVRLVTDDQEGGSTEPLSPIVANTAAPELLINGNFKDGGDDADVTSTEMLGWKVTDFNPDENTISRASDQVTFTAGLGGGSEDQLYIRSVDADGNINNPFDEGETYLVRVDVESISGLDPIFEPAGGPAFKTLVAGINEFLWTPPGNGPIDPSTGKGTDAAVIRKTSGQTGNFVLNRVSITKHSVDNKPYQFDLNATSKTNVVMYFESAANTPGTEYLYFAIDNNGSTDSEFQIDDVSLMVVNSATIAYTSNDLSFPRRGRYVLPVPDLGDTVYFNCINNKYGVATYVIVEKL